MERFVERWRRLRTIVGRGDVEAGLSEEIRFHIDQQTEKNIRRGLDPAEARRQAFVQFGGVEHVKEQTRDEFRSAFLEDFIRDLRYGARVLWRAKAFAFVSILTLGLGIGAATAVFSTINGVLLSPLPYPNPIALSASFRSTTPGGAWVTPRNRTSRIGRNGREALQGWP